MAERVWARVAGWVAGLVTEWTRGEEWDWPFLAPLEGQRCNPLRTIRPLTGEFMKRTGLGVLVLMLLLLFASVSLAQQRTGRTRSNGWGLGNLYDPKTIETIKGEILQIDEFALVQGMPPGVRFILKTDKEAISVYLGPAWYLDDEDFEIEPQDTVEVKGSRVTYEGRPAVVAAVIFKGDRVLKLRDDSGFPVWSPWAPRR